MKRFFLSLILLLATTRGNCAWQNLLSFETGYRRDSICCQGPLQSASVNHFKKEVDADLWQINLKDRLTFNRVLFLQALGGYGYAFNTHEKAFITVPTYLAPGAIFNVAEPYSNLGAASNFFIPNGVSLPQVLSAATSEVYSARNCGHAWSFDLCLGTSLVLQNPCTISTFVIEPRLGYILEWFRANNSLRTQLQGGYLGIGFPFSVRRFWVVPEIAYIFEGSRSEYLGIRDLSQGVTNFFSFRHGDVRGIKAAIGLDYALRCNLFVGFNWRYFHLHTLRGRFATFQHSIFWKSETNWSSNQFLGKVTYVF